MGLSLASLFAMQGPFARVQVRVEYYIDQLYFRHHRHPNMVHVPTLGMGTWDYGFGSGKRGYIDHNHPILGPQSSER